MKGENKPLPRDFAHLPISTSKENEAKSSGGGWVGAISQQTSVNFHL
jgi:hypothetical protein